MGNEYGSLNYVPKQADNNKMDIGDNINRELNSNNPLNSDRNMLDTNLNSSPNRLNRLENQNAIKQEENEKKKDGNNNQPRSNSGLRVEKSDLYRGKEQNQQGNDVDDERSLCMIVVGKPEDDPVQDGKQVQRWLLRKKEAAVIPPCKFALVWIAFAGTVLVQLFQGAKGFDSVLGIKKCEPMDWTVFGIYLVFIFTVAMIGT